MPRELTLDEILAGAKQFLGQRSVTDDARDFATSEAAAGRAAQRLTPAGTIKAYGEPILQGLHAAALPAAFLSGPVGMAAGGLLSLEGLQAAAKDPSAMNVGVAALGALPFAKVAGRALKGAETAAKAEPEILRGSEMFSDVMGRGGKGPLPGEGAMRTPYTMPEAPAPISPNAGGRLTSGGTPTANAPIENSVMEGLNATLQQPKGVSVGRAHPSGGTARMRQSREVPYRSMSPKVYDPEAEVQQILGRDARTTVREGAKLRGTPQDVAHSPEAQALEALRTAAEVSPSMEVIPSSLNASGESAASLEALNRAGSMKAQGQQFVVYDRAGNARPLIGPDAVDYVPRQGETYGIQDASGFRPLTDRGGKVRPSASFVHPADTSGERFGFHELPSISEGELTRLQDLFKRLGH